MTLKDWAAREGLTYAGPGFFSQALLDEYGISEVVYRYNGHCLDCADWYVYRDDNGTLRRFTELGNSLSTLIISDEDLDTLRSGDCDGQGG